MSVMKVGSVSGLYPSIPPSPSPLPPKVRVIVRSSTFARVSAVSSACWREKGWRSASSWSLLPRCPGPAPSRVGVCVASRSRLSHGPPGGLSQACPDASSQQLLRKYTSDQFYSFNHRVKEGRGGPWQNVGRVSIFSPSWVFENSLMLSQDSAMHVEKDLICTSV